MNWSIHAVSITGKPFGTTEASKMAWLLQTTNVLIAPNHTPDQNLGSKPYRTGGGPRLIHLDRAVPGNRGQDLEHPVLVGKVLLVRNGEETATFRIVPRRRCLHPRYFSVVCIET
jgi:hypothetical protein